MTATNRSAGSPRPLHVFLCHASEDKPAVRALYQRLCAEGVQPWFDEEDLLPGQDWRAEIPRVVRASDAVIVCLSRASVAKAGYAQKEIKLTLDVLDEQPEGAIFLIPLKLEECDLPERLSHLHAVSLFAERGFERLMRALRRRAEELNAAPPGAGTPSGGGDSAARPPAEPESQPDHGTASPPRVSSSDTYSPYEHGMRQVLDRLGVQHPRYADALVYQQRLGENLTRTRRYGDTAGLRADRAEVIDRLNELALAALGQSFNALCHATDTPPPAAPRPSGAEGAPASTALPAPTELRRLLTDRFNASELRDLCFDMHIDDESLPGESKRDKARELTLYCQRHNRYAELVTECQRLRPDAFAPDPPRQR